MRLYDFRELLVTDCRAAFKRKDCRYETRKLKSIDKVMLQVNSALVLYWLDKGFVLAKKNLERRLKKNIRTFCSSVINKLEDIYHRNIVIACCLQNRISPSNSFLVALCFIDFLSTFQETRKKI